MKGRKCLERCLRVSRLIQGEETLEGVIEESGPGQTLDNVLCKMGRPRVEEIELEGGMYHQLLPYLVEINTKYKTVDKKIRPVVIPLPVDAKETLEKTRREPRLREPQNIGHEFTPETEELLQIGGDGLLTGIEAKAFKTMVLKYGKALSFSIDEIGCVDPKVVTPMIIFTVPHLPWDLRPIPVPRALLPKLVELLKEKLGARILERSCAPYSNRWFTVRKKNGKLRFIQDMQPPNGVTIRNVGSGPVVDEFAEEFAGRAIYSMGDLFSGYDQFQLAECSRDLTSLKTPLGLLRMCTIPQGGTNCVAHMQSGMEKVLQDFIPEVTRPFLDDVPMKGCREDQKDETVGADGLRQFVRDHIEKVEQVLKRLIEVGLTLSGEKTCFGRGEILVVGQMCGSYGRIPNQEKVDAIRRLKTFRTITEVRRFLGACVFYVIWIPHYATVAEPLYFLLRKGREFEWGEEAEGAVEALKDALTSAPVLRPLIYGGRIVILTIDASPFGAGWAVSQDNEKGERYAARFGAKTFDETQRRYPQVKRELWALKYAVNREGVHLIGTPLVIETDCQALLGMVINCTTPDIAMLRWIASIKMFNPELRHIKGSDNPVADMLSRARYKSGAGSSEESEDEGPEVVVTNLSHSCASGSKEVTGGKQHQELPVLEFREELYLEEFLEIGRYLSTLNPDPKWTAQEFRRWRQRSSKFFLKGGFLWKRGTVKGQEPLRVVGDIESRRRILEECHDAASAGHKGIQSTYERIVKLYWWPGVYKQVREYVESCYICQIYSKLRHRDGLVPTCPETLQFQWSIDIVHMPRGVRGGRYLVLAREEVSSYVEGRALAKANSESVCRFVLEEIICRYGRFCRMRCDRKELNSHEAIGFFKKKGIALKLTTAYNAPANGKIERGHAPIVNALTKACDGAKSRWPDLLPLALLADRTTVSTVTGFAPAELIQGHVPLMPIEAGVISWRMVDWRDNVSREELLQRRIELLNQTPERVRMAVEKIHESRQQNKLYFDKKHRQRPIVIQKGDWVLVSENKLDMEHSVGKKFAKRWRGPYVVLEVHPTATYKLRELDGSELRNLIAGKRVKLFKRRIGDRDVYADNESDAEEDKEAIPSTRELFEQEE